MYIFHTSVKSAWIIALAFCCLFVQSSCTTSQNLGIQVHHLAMENDKNLPITIQLPDNWHITTGTAKDEISLSSSAHGEQASITAKKLEVDQVKLKLLKAFGRIHLKEHTNEGWIEQRFADNIEFDGNQALQYVLRKDSKAALVYLVGKGQYIYTITITAPAAHIAKVNDKLKKNISLGEQVTSKEETLQLTQDQSYVASPNILNLQISQYYYAQESYERDISKALTFHERIVLLEQVCFKYSLLKSESLLHRIDKNVLRILKDIEQLYALNKDHPGLARCDALRSYLNNRLVQAITKFETILKENPKDIHSILYLAMIRPYDSGIMEKIPKETFEAEENNILAIFLQSKHYLAKGKKRASYDLLKKTLKRHTDNMWLSFAVARNYHNEGKSEKAQQLYTEVLRLFPPFSPARFNLAFILYKEKQHLKALKHLENILTIHHDDANTNLLQGLILKNKGKGSKAKQAFERALTIEPDNYRALYNIGALCASKLDDTNCARQAFNRYIIVAPQDNRHASIVSWLNKH